MNRRTSSISILALACLLLLPSPVSAMLHPVQSRFLQRDVNGYAKGQLSLHEIEHSSPLIDLDPSGMEAVALHYRPTHDSLGNMDYLLPQRTCTVDCTDDSVAKDGAPNPPWVAEPRDRTSRGRVKEAMKDPEVMKLAELARKWSGMDPLQHVDCHCCGGSLISSSGFHLHAGGRIPRREGGAINGPHIGFCEPLADQESVKNTLKHELSHWIWGYKFPNRPDGGGCRELLKNELAAYVAGGRRDFEQALDGTVGSACSQGVCTPDYLKEHDPQLTQNLYDLHWNWTRPAPPPVTTPVHGDVPSGVVRYP